MTFNSCLDTSVFVIWKCTSLQFMFFQTLLPSNGFASYKLTDMPNQLTLCLMQKQLEIWFLLKRLFFYQYSKMNCWIVTIWASLFSHTYGSWEEKGSYATLRQKQLQREQESWILTRWTRYSTMVFPQWFPWFYIISE